LFRINLLYDDELNAALPQIDNKKNLFYTSWSYVVLILAIHLIIDYLNYKYERNRRIEHHAASKLMVQQTNSYEMLSLLLPDFVKDKYDQFMGGKVYKEIQEEPVAILFCEILDFNKILIEQGPGVVQILDQVFKEFDKLCRQYGIQKIETVGSSYVACAGLKASEVHLPKSITANPPTRRLLYMALDMVQFASQKKISEGKNMKIWVGIHYGKCAAGVIGYHKPQFSLIGDTVNTTSRVCVLKLDKKGEEAERLKEADIRLSNEAYNNLIESGGPGRKGIVFEPVYGVQFKGKPMTTIWLCKKESEKKAGNNVNAKGPLKKLIGVVQTVIQQIDEQKKTKILKIKQLIEIAQEEKEKIIEDQRIMRDAEKQDDDDEEEDEDINLRPSRIFLTLDAYTWSKVKKFEWEVLQKNKNFYTWVTFAIFVIHLLQSIFMYLIKDNFEHHDALFGLRLGFLPMLVASWLTRDWLFWKRVLRHFTLTIFLYAIIITLLEAKYTQWPTYQNIQLVEVMLLYLAATHIK